MLPLSPESGSLPVELDTTTGLFIYPDRDSSLSPFSRAVLDGFYLRPGESPQQGYARACKAWSAGDDELAQRLYDAVSRGWFMFASPVLANAPLPGEKVRGLPISCYLVFTPDSLEGLMAHSTETRWLSVLGGGVGGHWSAVRSVSDKAPGPIPFLHTIDADMEAFRQGTTRRGSYAAFLDVSHPDIVEFLALRRPGGDEARKCFSAGFNHGVNISDAFMQAVLEGKDWELVDPYDKTVRGKMPARELWQEILETRYRTGEPYLYFIDTARQAMPQAQKDLGLELHGSNLCVEITLPTNEERTAVCCLSSLNLEHFDEWKGTRLVQDLITMLDNVLEYFIQNAPEVLAKAKFSAMRERAVGLGAMGFHAYLQKHMIAFESEAAREANQEIFKHIAGESGTASKRLAALRGEAPDMAGTGHRMSHQLALAPNANSAILLDTSPSIEPYAANAYVHDMRAGSWLVKNPYLLRLLAERGYDNEAIWQDIITNRGSVQHLEFLSEHERAVFKTAIEINQMWIVRHAADRQPRICQAQSVNLFFPPRADRAYVNAVHIAAWEGKLKSLYYCRTMTPNRAENVSQKLERRALKDADADCLSCQG